MRTAVTLIRTVTEKDNEGFARKTDKTVAVFRAYRNAVPLPMTDARLLFTFSRTTSLKPAKAASESACIDAMVRTLEEEIKKI